MLLRRQEWSFKNTLCMGILKHNPSHKEQCTYSNLNQDVWTHVCKTVPVWLPENNGKSWWLSFDKRHQHHYFSPPQASPPLLVTIPNGHSVTALLHTHVFTSGNVTALGK
jgi:hypothetical protein